MGGCVEVYDCTLTLRNLDGLTLRHRGGYAPLQGVGENARLVVEESVVTAECGSPDAYSAAITGLRGGIELRWSAVETPASLGLDADGTVTDGAGQSAARVVIRRAPKLTILSRGDDCVRYQIDNLPAGGEGLRLAAAAYDAEGRLLDLGFQDLTGADGAVTDTIPIVGNAPAYKLFLLDKNNRPIAEYAE